MSTRHAMKPLPLEGGYLITLNNEAACPVLGAKAAWIYFRWSRLRDSHPLLADAYLEGIVEGLRYAMFKRSWIADAYHEGFAEGIKEERSDAEA